MYKKELSLFIHSDLAHTVFLTDTVIGTMIEYRHVRWLRQAVGPLINEIAQLPLDERALPQADRSDAKARDGGGIELSYYAENGYQRIYSLVPQFAIPKQPDDEPDPPTGGAAMQVPVEPEIAVVLRPILLPGFGARARGGAGGDREKLGMTRLLQVRIPIAILRRLLAELRALASEPADWGIAALTDRGPVGTLVVLDTAYVDYAPDHLLAVGADTWWRALEGACIISTETNHAYDGQSGWILTRFMSSHDGSTPTASVRDHHVHGAIRSAYHAYWSDLKRRIEAKWMESVMDTRKSAFRNREADKVLIAGAFLKLGARKGKTKTRAGKAKPIWHDYPIGS